MRRGPALATILFFGGAMLLSTASDLVCGRPASPAELAARPPHRVRIDANRDPWFRLSLLEGIGEVRARRLVRHRRTEGPFESLEEVARAAGLPEGWISEVRDVMILGGKSP